MADLTVEYGDVWFKNPIVAVAGPLRRKTRGAISA